MAAQRTVSIVSLGCGRNDVDSEELAGRLAGAGWRVEAAADGDDLAPGADAVLVNTCGFVAEAKKDSIDMLLAAADHGRPVVAVGCLAERYGRHLAAELPEVTVLGFDDYPDIADRLDDVLAGRPLAAHEPRDRRRMLPVSPVLRPGAATVVPGHGQAGVGAVGPAVPQSATGRGVPWHGPDIGTPGPAGPPALRRRLNQLPWAPLKLASGCDRRCSFCAIPAFRGRYVSRPPDEVLAEAAALAADGVRELVLVSENSTSYGKDLGDLRLLERLLPDLAATPGIVRVRVVYLQPAEVRPGLVEVIGGTAGVAPYFDLSFQHASGPVLRRMRRFGDADAFLQLLARVRAVAPEAGVRSNVIVGFPGETEADLDVLARFLGAARLDAVGVFGYSDEDGTEAVGLAAHLPGLVVARRREDIALLAEELVSQRSVDRVGSVVEVLVEEAAEVVTGSAGWQVTGRSAHQGPETDGVTAVRFEPGDAGTGSAGRHASDPTPSDRHGTGPVRSERVGSGAWQRGQPAPHPAWPEVGALVVARVVAAEGADLVAVPVAAAEPGRAA